MIDNHRLDANHGVSRSNRFRRASSGRLLPAVLLICLLACQGFVVFGTGIPSPSDKELGMLRFVGKGPIQIEVVDPDGLTVSRGENDIEGAMFTDENDEVTIEIPQRKVGTYQVDVNLDGSSSRLQRFDVSVSDGATTLMLADRELIANAPQDPYLVRSDAEGFDLASEDEADVEGGGLSTTVIVIVVAGALILLIGGMLFFRSRKKKA